MNNTTKKCFWKGCKTKIQVDTSIESDMSFVTVEGWCDVHKLAYSIFHELEREFCKRKRISFPPNSVTYPIHKIALHELNELAEYRAKEKIKHD